MGRAHHISYPLRPTEHSPPGAHFQFPHPRLVANALLAGARVFVDSNRTEDILTIEEAMIEGQLNYLLESNFMARGEGADIMRERPELKDVDPARFWEMPEGSFGRAVAAFLDRNSFTYLPYQSSSDRLERNDPTANYLLRRIRESHDFWHVLMDFNTDGHEEILIHAFTLAQVGNPVSVALLVFGGLKHMVFEGRIGCLRSGLTEAYRRGSNASSLLTVYWERHFDKPLEQVRRELGVTPWTAADRNATAPFKLRGPSPTQA